MKRNSDLSFTKAQKHMMFKAMAAMVVELKTWHPELDLGQSMEAVLSAHTVAQARGVYERVAARFRAKIPI